ncbi:hypothetical protein [Devosia sp. 2618]|uniref:hypothetical protein n=1 Tax=Devosia sp. 2618 TaxID=3156454 RepID=UPI0033970C76
MKMLFATALIVLAGSSAAQAFDADTQAIVEHQKVRKLLNTTDVGHLMAASERWCYAEIEGTCAWSDIYLDVDESAASFELGNAWTDDLDIAYTNGGYFEDDRYICAFNIDWTPTLRATRRDDGTAIGGRELAAIKAELQHYATGATEDCFDYLYLSADAKGQTITLLQRQYEDGEYVVDKDVQVTLHFNPRKAAALTQRL